MELKTRSHDVYMHVSKAKKGTFHLRMHSALTRYKVICGLSRPLCMYIVTRVVQGHVYYLLRSRVRTSEGRCMQRSLSQDHLHIRIRVSCVYTYTTKTISVSVFVTTKGMN